MRVLWMGLVALLTLGGASAADAETRTAVVAGGCFWCVEKDFESVPGVSSVVSGYAGGTKASASYDQVSGGGTGHYEAVQITYDASQLSYDGLLALFYRSIDPTDAGGQFCDRGDSYRTAIFVDSAAERASAKAATKQVEAVLGSPVATAILPLKGFYPAEDYHQDYHRSGDIILTRFGPRTKASAYKLYRKACGRDARVQEVWGNEAAFAR